MHGTVNSHMSTAPGGRNGKATGLVIRGLAGGGIEKMPVTTKAILNRGNHMN